jgi:hypothetical protein
MYRRSVGSTRLLISSKTFAQHGESGARFRELPCAKTGTRERCSDRFGGTHRKRIGRGVKRKDAFPAASMDGFTASRKMRLRSVLPKR